jgi:hypothetical protein
MNPGIHGAIAASQAARRRKQEQEEERMTRYSDEELDGEWEFKIVRSEFPVFRNRNKLAQVVEEEALAGWQMLEKLDDNRIRFKRHVSNRRRDEMLPQQVDPYRTQIGGLGGAAVVAGLLVGLLLLGIGGFLFLQLRGDNISFGGGTPWILVTLIAGILVALGAAAFAFMRK